MKIGYKIPTLLLMASLIFCTTVQAQDTSENISTKEKEEVITAVGKLMEEQYVFPVVGKAMSTHLKLAETDWNFIIIIGNP